MKFKYDWLHCILSVSPNFKGNQILVDISTLPSFTRNGKRQQPSFYKAQDGDRRPGLSYHWSWSRLWCWSDHTSRDAVAEVNISIPKLGLQGAISSPLPRPFGYLASHESLFMTPVYELLINSFFLPVCQCSTFSRWHICLIYLPGRNINNIRNIRLEPNAIPHSFPRAKSGT